MQKKLGSLDYNYNYYYNYKFNLMSSCFFEILEFIELKYIEINYFYNIY